MISWLGDFPGNLSFSLILLYIFLCVNLQPKRVKQYSHFLVLPKEQKYAINAPQLFFFYHDVLDNYIKVYAAVIYVPTSALPGRHCLLSPLMRKDGSKYSKKSGALPRMELMSLTTSKQNLHMVQDK